MDIYPANNVIFKDIQRFASSVMLKSNVHSRKQVYQASVIFRQNLTPLRPVNQKSASIQDKMHLKFWPYLLQFPQKR